ncbi:MAG: thioredoxin family protein [Candidatus ainarchaeum sp.]|nr:thioredoxin family protein [Candidatus ainarchaeum sp.]
MNFKFSKIKIFSFFLIFLLLFSLVFAQDSVSLIESNVYLESETTPVVISEVKDVLVIDYFYMTGCSACARMGPFLEKLVSEYNSNEIIVQLNSYEISSPQNSNLFSEKLLSFGVPADRQGYVPTVFINDKYFIGFSSDISDSINKLAKDFFENNSDSNDSVIINPDNSTKIDTTILGFLPFSVYLAGDTFTALLISTVILAGLDSLNICSITVLLFLIVYLVSIGSLKRVLKTGFVFIIVIYLFYFLFMLILSTIINNFILEFGFYIRLIIISACLFVGALLIKDFFFYGKGFSLSVPKSAKPILEKYLKQATLISTIIFALLASLVELPCTAVFPMVYSTILAEGMIGAERILWIAFYNLIYILPLLLIVLGTYFSWISVEDIDKKIQANKTKLKLLSGVMLILIAIYFALPFLI